MKWLIRFFLVIGLAILVLFVGVVVNAYRQGLEEGRRGQVKVEAPEEGIAQ